MRKKLAVMSLILTLLFSGCVKESYTSIDPHINFPFEEEFEYEVVQVDVEKVDQEVDVFAYEFKVDETLEYPIEIILPYKAKGMSEDEQTLSVVGKYLNEDTNEWEDVLYMVNPEDETITILTDHFSTYGVFVIKNPNKRSEYISSVNPYALKLSTEKALEIIESYGKNEPGWQDNIASFFLEAANDGRFGHVSDGLTVLNLGESYAPGFLSSLSDSLSNLGLAASSFELAYNLYRNGLNATESQIDMMKYALGLAVNAASTHIQLAFIGVNVIDTALNEVGTYAVQTKYEATQNMYRAYYKRKENKRSATDWYRIFMRIYESYKDDGEKVMKLIDLEIDQYVNKYWEVAETDWESWIDAYDDNATLTKYPWPLEQDRLNISNHFKEELRHLLQSPLIMLNRKMYFDLYDAQKSAVEKYARELNRIITFNFKEDKSDDGKYEFGNAYLALSPLPETHDKSAWAIKLNGKGEGTLKFTLLAHHNANAPMSINLYKTKENFEEDNVDKTYTLSQIKHDTTTFTFNKKQKFVDYSGTFKGSMTNTKTSKETSVTTTIKLVEKKVDGGIYQINAQNMAKGTYYIKGEYFIRNTGVANVAGAEFTMSKNGGSFEANMLDSQDRVWGILRGYK